MQTPPSIAPRLLLLDTVPPPAPTAGLVLVYQSTPEREREIAEVLGGDELTICTASSFQELTQVVRDRQPDLVVLDWTMPECPAVCQAMKAGTSRMMPIVVLDWCSASEADVVTALDSGADEFFEALGRQEELRARIRSQLRNKRRLDSLTRIRAERDTLRFDARLDALTGVLNRRALDATLANLTREGGEFAALFLDVDHFKQVNDDFGHAAGDLVLTAVGRLLRDCLRPDDVVGRYGGEEFVVLLRGADVDVSRRVAERIRSGASALVVEGVSRRVTVSIGAAVKAAEADTAGEVVHAADRALMRAKRAGRNRVLVAEDAQGSGPPAELQAPPPRRSFQVLRRADPMAGVGG